MENAKHSLWIYLSVLAFSGTCCAQRGPQSQSCGEPRAIAHGVVTIFREGTYASYQCNSGFSLYGTQNMRCLGNGRWSAEEPICVAPGCSPLPNFPLGRTSSRMSGAVVVYKCPKGTWVRGSKTIFCDGQRWNDTVPTCHGIRSPDFLPTSNCPLPPRVPNAMSDLGFESVTYTCVNRTFPTVGSLILRCLSTGQWDRPPVVCARPGCSRLSEPANGLVIEMHGRSVVEFRCFLHYHLLGSRTLFCDGRRWNGTTPSCVQELPVDPAVSLPGGTGAGAGGGGGEVPASTDLFTVEEGTTCGQAQTIRYGQPRYTTELDDRGSTYWSLEYVCNSGYRPLKNKKLFCSRAVWVGELPQCVAFCGVNNGGCSHSCLSINGRATCTCRPGYRLHINGRNCNDVNECAANSRRGPCSEICSNFAGGYQCSCQRGYRLNEDGHSCSYQEVNPCSRIRCAYGSCVSANGTASCQCPRGFLLSRDGRTCQDIDECAREVPPCEHECRNTFGSFECLCPTGAALMAGRRCQECDVNSYLSSNGRRCIPCPENSGTRGAGPTSISACRCVVGYEGNPARERPCTDINECADRNGQCDHSCENTLGSFFCKCRPGYTLDAADQRSCIEIDECALNNGGCQHSCRNSPGSFSCICNEGYAVDRFDRRNCLDVDECAFDSSRCQQICTNTPGSYYCGCREGFTLNNDLRTCTADVCPPMTSPPGSLLNETCQSPPGVAGLSVGTRCVYQCSAGYILNGGSERTCMPNGRWSERAPTCVRVQCPVLPRPEFGRVSPKDCRQSPGELGALCSFSCDTGFNLLGRSALTCSSRGEWSTRAPICSSDAKIRCPDDVTATLPPASSRMTLDLLQADHVLDFINATHPLTGHVFGVGQSKVTFTAFSNDTSVRASCAMRVTILDEEPPQLLECPLPYTVKTPDLNTTSYELPQPVFTDNVGIVNITQTRDPAGPITWGAHTVRFVATDRAGNSAECAFTVTVQALSLDCGVLDGPLNGNHFCSPWRNGQICQPTCLPGYYFFDGALSSPTYVCGRDAQWDPAKRVPDCMAFETVTNRSVPCAPGKQLREFPALGGPACMDCPRGMYSVHLGPATQPVCKACPQGLYQDRHGQISCLVCPAGTTTPSTGAKSARDCQNTMGERSRGRGVN